MKYHYPKYREDNNFHINDQQRQYFHPVPEYKRMPDPYLDSLKNDFDDNPITEMFVNHPEFVELGIEAGKVWRERRKKRKDAVIKALEKLAPDPYNKKFNAKDF